MMNKSICDCGDKDCKRELKGTKEGKLYVVNHFTCGKVKELIKKYGSKNLRVL